MDAFHVLSGISERRSRPWRHALDATGVECLTRESLSFAPSRLIDDTKKPSVGVLFLLTDFVGGRVFVEKETSQ
jgi:hypothetical protein